MLLQKIYVAMVLKDVKCLYTTNLNLIHECSDYRTTKAKVEIICGKI